MFVKFDKYYVVNVLKCPKIHLDKIILSFGEIHITLKTEEQAKKAFDLICEALSQDKKYLDLNKHLQ